MASIDSAFTDRGTTVHFSNAADDCSRPGDCRTAHLRTELIESRVGGPPIDGGASVNESPLSHRSSGMRAYKRARIQKEGEA